MSADFASSRKVVHVAVGVIRIWRTGEEYILLSKRLDHVHQGGLWEFPGGKVEPGEDVQVALARELREELGIDVPFNNASCFSPLIQIRHDYPDKSVFLDVWYVNDFSGEPQGLEGQEVRWVHLTELSHFDFPEANKPIITACQLPSNYIITPSYPSLNRAKEGMEYFLERNASMILLRQPELSIIEYREWVSALLSELPRLRGRLMLTGAAFFEDGVFKWGDCDNFRADIKGVQLPFYVASQMHCRPIEKELTLSVSCHSLDEIKHAERLQADFITLSPVRKTVSHPEVAAMGWERFNEIVSHAKLPAYALGGLSADDSALASKNGAQGIAGISCWQVEIKESLDE